ncbi:RNA polymerase, sigma-24 subunit, ECF subfamily [Chitinophaga pinensis DSM 2588]|uniref:RNA polymerase, sigma-24 subunit, ECF subfamily n=1 Tax=Chitinophaga pinensis (strain ATCC 43595 / DSM 2588 / LMG 13176 / NBRC 15968 / NCIMB 11800 / UQM 2034) TaxID=485918 RepID=A0A979GAZ0_CHIPD|nr:RNA polymerase, sigma-24 subunit, ECF subfamily [Chitinophaga pinensis DSM 2588]
MKGFRLLLTCREKISTKVVQTPDHATIQILAGRIATGDEQAYRQLFRQFYKPLCQFAASIVRSNEQAEEIASDVFMNIWKNRERLLQVSNLKVYLYVAARNTALNYLNQQQLQHFSIDELSVDLSVADNTPEQLMISGEMARKMADAVNNLPPRCKMIYKLIREDGLKYKEVASILEISVNTIDVQMAIACKKISESLRLYLPKR